MEKPFTGELIHCNDPGTYNCSACNAEVFLSETKLRDDSGYCSFW
jgi:peptide methionine sulfoxide reductase MsrB